MSETNTSICRDPRARAIGATVRDGLDHPIQVKFVYLKRTILKRENARYATHWNLDWLSSTGAPQDKVPRTDKRKGKTVGYLCVPFNKAAKTGECIADDCPANEDSCRFFRNRE